MNGITAVYIVFAIVLAAIFGYIFLLSRRQRDLEGDLQDLRQAIEKRAASQKK